MPQDVLTSDTRGTKTFRKMVGIASALLLVFGGTLQLRAFQDPLPKMTAAEMEAVVGADGYFEKCIRFETGCIEDPVTPAGDPCGAGCGAYCPGGQTDGFCDDSWLPTSCHWTAQVGCDGIPYKCDPNGRCIDANLGAGPNPVSCGTFNDCN